MNNRFFKILLAAIYFFIGTAFAIQMFNPDRTLISNIVLAAFSFVWFFCGVECLVPEQEKSED